MITPNTTVRLLTGVPLTNKNEHQMTFADIHAQAAYFTPKTLFSFTDFTYQREDNAIKVPKGYDELYNVNYIMYQNTNYAGKWFYAFVTKREYVNPNTTRLYLELDVWQTYQFDITLKQSFVEREHAKRWNADGTPVINTVDEGLDYGSEYKTVSVEQYRPSGDVYYLVAACKQTMHQGLDKAYYASLNGLPQLVVYYVHPFKLDGSAVNSSQGALSSITDFLAVLYTQSNAVNNVISLYVTDALPTNPSYSNDTLGLSTSNYERVALTGKLNTVDVHTVFVKDMTYGNWTYFAGDKYNGFTDVEESKLLMYPYTVTELVDLRGNKAIYRNEYIDSTDLSISISASLGLNNKISYTIKDYLTGALQDDTIKIKVNQERGLINNDPNDLPIFTDLLGAYLQGNRNALQNQMQQIAWEGSFGAAGNIMTANAAGVVHGLGSSYLQVKGISAQIKDIKNQFPEASKMGSNVYFDYGHRLTGVWIVKKEITPEYRKRLTDFFKMYGYKVNELKVPNIRSRASFNFIKCVGANITGNVPHDELSQIIELFNKGITFWHTANVGDYSLTNGEV